ncbi:acetylcholinesterase-like [Glandiceps talaboti]
MTSKQVDYVNRFILFFTFLTLGHTEDVTIEDAGIQYPTVTTPQGSYTGILGTFQHKDLDGVRQVKVFTGIPYAEPPVGPLRFKPPVPKKPVGNWNATYFREVCPQFSFPSYESEPTSEDCLFLNLYIPHPTPEKTAVLVWLHGGAFYIASGSAPENDGTVLSALGDVIVVTLNYRLGPLGFLSTGDSASPGNYGLMDQRQAVIWIKENIAAFGGDPDRITLSGQSAGAASIGLHLFSPMNRGLFQRAIMQSGTAFSPWATVPSPEIAKRRAFALASLVGCDQMTTGEIVTCMRKTPAADLAKAQLMVTKKTGEKRTTLAFTPIIDGDFIPDDPKVLLKAGRYNNADLIIGANSDEGTMTLFYLFPHFYNETEPKIDLKTFTEYIPVLTYAEGGQLIHKSAQFLYTDWTHADYPDVNYFTRLSQLTGDESFICPANAFAHVYSELGNSVYLYHYTHKSSTSIFNVTWLGASHAEEVPFVFGWHFLRHMEMTYESREILLSLQVMSMWTNFAKTGDPVSSDWLGAADLTWPRYTIPEMTYKDLSPGLANKRALKATECRFWNIYVPHLSNALSCPDNPNEVRTENDKPDPCIKKNFADEYCLP